MFWSAKNSVAIFSCQSLLLGTNIPYLMIATTLWLLHTIYNLADHVFCSVRCSLIILVYWSEIISACAETTWQHETSSCMAAVVASYHVLLFQLLRVSKYGSQLCENSFEVHACTVSLPHFPNIRKKWSFHKLICVI